jgi:hypothetical protein
MMRGSTGFIMLLGDSRPAGRSIDCAPRAGRLNHDDFGLIQSKIMNVIDSKDWERGAQISLRNLRRLDRAGKPVPTFPHPALGADHAQF